jgi:coenzyme PQQ precursor peptide PqqA
LAVNGVRSVKTAAEKQPPKEPEPERRIAEQEWFPPDFQDFETAMEVTAYAGRR